MIYKKSQLRSHSSAASILPCALTNLGPLAFTWYWAKSLVQISQSRGPFSLFIPSHLLWASFQFRWICPAALSCA